jgi:hypothetical protein
MNAKIALAALLSICLLGYQGSARAANDSFLLFPFVYGGGIAAGEYDTIIGIANTSADPLGTTHQSGECALWFYGTDAPPSYQLTTTIAAGGIYFSAISAVAPGITGYVIAACNFPYAHGSAFLGYNGTIITSIAPLSIVTPRPATEENLNN